MSPLHTPWSVPGVSSLSSVSFSKIPMIFCEVVSMLLSMHEWQIIEWVGRKLIVIYLKSMNVLTSRIGSLKRRNCWAVRVSTGLFGVNHHSVMTTIHLLDKWVRLYASAGLLNIPSVSDHGKGGMFFTVLPGKKQYSPWECNKGKDLHIAEIWKNKEFLNMVSYIFKRWISWDAVLSDYSWWNFHT